MSEFGSRRAQGPDAAVLGARASYIAGCAGTACTLADEMYGSPAGGTMAHSWVQMFPDEYTAFKTYCQLYPHSATLLVDTYNVLKSGVPNAIRAFQEVLLPQGITNCAIRLDSGDLTYLSRKARKMLDAAGLPQCKIVASNSLDEYIIRDLLLQGAQIDSFGVGERLITSKSEPVFGGVYKLSAIRASADEPWRPVIKLSEQAYKRTIPGVQRVLRFFDEAECPVGDMIYQEGSDPSCDEMIDILDSFRSYSLVGTSRELFVRVVDHGCGTEAGAASIEHARERCKSAIMHLDASVTRFLNPQTYPVGLELSLAGLRQELSVEERRSSGRAVL